MVSFFSGIGRDFIFCLQATPNQDELESIHAAWKIFSGQTIYRDFFEHHHPFFYYLLVPLVGIFNENIKVMIAARGLVFVMLLLIFAVTYRISKSLFGPKSAVISLILLGSTKFFILSAIEIRPDVPETLSGLACIFFLLSCFRNGSRRCFITSAMLLGLSFLFLQKAIFLIFVMGGFLIFGACFRQIRWRDLFLYAITFAATVMPYYLYLMISGQMQAYLAYNWFLNVYLYQSPSWPCRAEQALSIMLISIKSNFLLWIFWFLSPLYLQDPHQKRALALSVFLTSFLFVQFPYRQDLILMTPLMAVMAGYAINRTANMLPQWSSFLTGVILAVAIAYPLSYFLKIIRDLPEHPPVKRDGIRIVHYQAGRLRL